MEVLAVEGSDASPLKQVRLERDADAQREADHDDEAVAARDVFGSDDHAGHEHGRETLEHEAPHDADRDRVERRAQLAEDAEENVFWLYIERSAVVIGIICR